MNTIAASCDDLHRLTLGERRTARSASASAGRAPFPFVWCAVAGEARKSRRDPQPVGESRRSILLPGSGVAHTANFRTVRAGGVTGPDVMSKALLSATGSGLRSEPPRVSVRAGRFLATSLTGGRANAVAVFSLTNIAAT